MLGLKGGRTWLHKGHCGAIVSPDSAGPLADRPEIGPTSPPYKRRCTGTSVQSAAHSSRETNRGASQDRIRCQQLAILSLEPADPPRLARRAIGTRSSIAFGLTHPSVRAMPLRIDAKLFPDLPCKRPRCSIRALQRVQTQTEPADSQPFKTLPQRCRDSARSKPPLPPPNPRRSTAPDPIGALSARSPPPQDRSVVLPTDVWPTVQPRGLRALARLGLRQCRHRYRLRPGRGTIIA